MRVWSQLLQGKDTILSICLQRVISGLFLLLLVLVVRPSYGMNIYNIYGNKDHSFIISYNQRLLKNFLSYNEDFRKCVSDSLEEKITKEILPRHKGWGQVLADGMALVYHFEVFYRSVSADSPLEKGIRVEIPTDYSIQVGKHQIRSANNAFGFEIYLNHKGECVEHKVQRFMNHLLIGDKERLDLKVKVFPDVERYPFFELIKAEIGDKENRNVLFLRSFHFLYLNPKVFPYANHHLKEFQQLLLRITWKSPDEFTLYFPQ